MNEKNLYPQAMVAETPATTARHTTNTIPPNPKQTFTETHQTHNPNLLTTYAPMKLVKYTATLYRFDDTPRTLTESNTRYFEEELLTKYESRPDIEAFLISRAWKIFAATGGTQTGPIPDAITLTIHSLTPMATPKAPWTGPKPKR